MGEAYGMPDDPSPTTNSNFDKKIFYIQKVKKFSKSKMSRNFLSTSQEISKSKNVKKFSKSKKSSWALGWWWGGMAYQMTHLPPPPQRLTRKCYKSKNSSNFLSPTSQEFSMSNKSSWALGWWWEGMAYQMTHLPPPPQRLTRKFYKSKNSRNFLSPTSQEIF